MEEKEMEQQIPADENKDIQIMSDWVMGVKKELKFYKSENNALTEERNKLKQELKNIQESFEKLKHNYECLKYDLKRVVDNIGE